MPLKAIPRETRKGLVANPPSALPQSGHPPRRGPRQGKPPRKRRLWRGVELRPGRGRGSFPTRASEPPSPARARVRPLATTALLRRTRGCSLVGHETLPSQTSSCWNCHEMSRQKTSRLRNVVHEKHQQSGSPLHQTRISRQEHLSAQ